MDAHELVAAVKDLALELGRTPTRTEFESRIRGGNYKLAQFGGFTALLKAAGLDSYDDRRSGTKKKLGPSVFQSDLETHLEKYEPREVGPEQTYPTMAVISDIHWPFECQRVIDKFYVYVLENQPEWVILNGDAWDMYCHSKFPRSHNVFTPRQEQEMARAKNVAFWAEVKRVSPGSKCYQMMGNHDVRPLKRVLEAYPEAEDWIEAKMRELFTFDGVKTIMDPREELLITPEIVLFHGYRSQLGAHRDYTLMSCINGHTHRGGTVFRRIRGRTLFEGNSGFSGDPEAKGLTYTPQKITDWTPGFLALDKWGPRFIPG